MIGRRLTGSEIRRRRASVSRAFAAGLVALALTAIGVWAAFGGEPPWRDHYELRAVFGSVESLRERTPVRIAGVQVGEVVRVEHARPGSGRAVVTMRIEKEGRPVHEDAELKIRPRLFLEGNFFIDMRPGTPGTPELADGATIPVQQTTRLVAVGDVLDTLQHDTRRHLRTLLAEYSSALRGAGARGYRRSIRHWERAYRNQAIANDAYLGEQPHDLSRLIDTAGRVARGLDANPAALRDLIRDFDLAAGAFARERVALERAIAELPRTLIAAQPALRELDRALPPLRRFARDLRPSVRETGRAIPVALPYLRELRRLASRDALRGLVADLRPVVPALARLAERTTPMYAELRRASACETTVLGPWGRDRVPDPNFPAVGPVFQVIPKTLPGLASESRSGDANGQWIRTLTSAGDHTVALGDGTFAQAYFPVIGTNPPKPRERPPLRPDVDCETQEPPDLRSRPGPGEPTVARGLPDTDDARARYERAKRDAVEWLRDDIERLGLEDRFRVTLEEGGR